MAERRENFINNQSFERQPKSFNPKDPTKLRGPKHLTEYLSKMLEEREPKKYKDRLLNIKYNIPPNLSLKERTEEPPLT